MQICIRGGPELVWLVKHYMSFVDIGDMDDVPVTLDWSLRYSENEIFGTEFAAKNSLTYSCYESNSTFSYIIGKFLLCQCFNGFEGNPYLPGGCQDIDECKEHSGFLCGSGATCVNTFGSYECPKPKAIQKSIKTVADQQSYEEVEYVRTEIREPWDVSTIIGSNESPLLSK
ncbi:hypothetical protein FEM48_Zijuj04G0157000 [Ziziphus jujuba var. spinosa]|uniref:EGF-like calcium-binding domain-containing protein n=1 Tax=Ziziphus jujuba var. spinosa TaxID=714518 RepID=A0A978VKQ9_ZIZJJ|nr:hypothetical protein FEM48_Zijuj04G0157000 [Ziziphus jujuba var. spinosa]